MKHFFVLAGNGLSRKLVVISATNRGSVNKYICLDGAGENYLNNFEDKEEDKSKILTGQIIVGYY